MESGKADELELLMLDYRWTMRQLKVSRYLRLESDFCELLKSRTQQRKEREGACVQGPAHGHRHLQRADSSGNSDHGRCGSNDEIEFIAKALRTSWSRVNASMEELDFRQLSFQLVERLATAIDHMLGVKRYLGSVTEWTRRPCSLPLEGCLRSVGESVEEVYVGSEMLSVALLPDPNKIVVGVWSGEVLLVHKRSAEIVKRYVGYPDAVASVRVSRDGRWMVSGSWNGTVRRWDVEGGVGIG